jgi:hypothetical protein
VSSLGNSVAESPRAVAASQVGRVSVADASLSLSLSLWPGRFWRSRRRRQAGVFAAAGRAPGVALLCPPYGGSCPRSRGSFSCGSL